MLDRIDYKFRYDETDGDSLAGPYHSTFPHHLKRVIYPACLVIFLEFIHDLDSVFASGPIIEQEYAVFVIEAVSVTDGEAVTRQEYQRTVRRSVPVL